MGEQGEKVCRIACTQSPRECRAWREKRMREIKRDREKNEEWRSKQRGRRGLARRLRLWLPLLSVCTEMSEHCDILPYSFPCCPAATVKHTHHAATDHKHTHKLWKSTFTHIHSKKHIRTCNTHNICTYSITSFFTGLYRAFFRRKHWWSRLIIL